MDSKLFNLPTSHVSKPSMTAGLPTEDSRFPGWAAVMTDGRLVTDYRSSRETNIPVRAQERRASGYNKMRTRSFGFRAPEPPKIQE